MFTSRLTILMYSVALVGCHAALPAPASFAGCYALAWHDSVWDGSLPDSVRLDATLDTLLGPRYTNSFLLRPAAQRQDASDHWRGLMNAWWRPVSHDSVALTLASVDAIWQVYLHRTGDSLRGSATFSMNAEESPPFSVSGKRIACPNARGA